MRRVILILIGLIVLSAGGYFFVQWLSMGSALGYEPNQPLPRFSHKKHTKDFKIPCMYCHINVEKSRHATVPSMNICMNCHKYVRAGIDPEDPDTYSADIQKLKAYYEKGEAIPWVKVHDQPDFVYFSHKRHVLKGIDCTACHGNVTEMDKIQQVKTLNMGFCLDCHKSPEHDLNPSRDCVTCHQ